VLALSVVCSLLWPKKTAPALESPAATPL
jgi:hypothetical protein